MLLTALLLYASPSHMETYLGCSQGATLSTMVDGYTREQAKINQSKTTSVRILSLALVISCLYFRHCVIFNLILSHLQREGFSLCLKIPGTRWRGIDPLEKMMTRKSNQKQDKGMRKERKESLAYILGCFCLFVCFVLILINWFVSCCFKGMSLFVLLVSPDHDK